MIGPCFFLCDIGYATIYGALVVLSYLEFQTSKVS
jgi:hypothetical protein